MREVAGPTGARPHSWTLRQEPRARAGDREQTLASFDWQWAHLAAGDFMPGDPWFDQHASRILSEELCALRAEWFAGRRVLDAGCGQGRWTRALLDLGAAVTAVDYSEAGLRRTRELCGPTPHLTTRRVDLLAIPPELAETKFDLVFSFGVLHHTGDTWRALENVAGLVDERGALVLYLYGARSWSREERERNESLRRSLAPLSFEAKIAELRSRFPHDDPHQLFDLLSPTINERVLIEDVAQRLRDLGFGSVTQTVESSEVYVRATRPGFPADALRPPVGSAATFAAEASRRWALRRGAGFESVVRSALQSVPLRPLPDAVRRVLERLPGGARVLDASMPPDRVEDRGRPDTPYTRWRAGGVAAPDQPPDRHFDAVLWLGASHGTCGDPMAAVEALWGHLAPGGRLFLEVSPEGFPRARRSTIDRLVDRRATVPEKLARLLGRRPTWCVGEGLFALGSDALLHPHPVDRATELLRRLGADRIDVHASRPDAVLVTATLGR